MKKNKLNKVRLSAFATYLENNELESKKYFDPNLKLTLSKDGGPKEFINPIPVMALIELPYIFPEEWMYNNKNEPVLKNQQSAKSFRSIQNWFGITSEQMEHLFIQRLQQCERFGGRVITQNSTKMDLAYNIRELIKSAEPNAMLIEVCLN